MSIEQNIASLTQATTDLLEAVNVPESTLDTKVSTAQAKVTEATAKVALAEAEKTATESAEQQAQTYRDNALASLNAVQSAVDYQELEAIAQTKSVTAVDVFVYDTSKDSDGGAWRKRCNKTSWYKEPLNTATRGSRREFPAVAVIVAESDKVTIYDGDDETLPMWMVFPDRPSVGRGFFSQAKGLNSIDALNGLIFIGNNADGNSATGLEGISLISDELLKYSVYVNDVGIEPIIANRTLTPAPVGGTLPAIVDFNVNDVAMTVLPDAPVDASTGLPIPTIAVATERGVSVIKDDGSVVDITNDQSTGSGNVIFLPDNKILFTFWNNYTSFVYEIPNEDTVHGSESANGNSLEAYHSYESRTPDLQLSDLYYSGVLHVTNIKKDLAYGLRTNSDSDHSLALLNRNTVEPNKGMLNYITSTYSTGWMNGDIKLATLSSSNESDLVGGVELADFSLASAHNNSGQTSISTSGSDIVFTYVSGAPSWGGFTFENLVVGDVYLVSFEATGEYGFARVGTSQNNGGSFFDNLYTFEATNTTMYLNFAIYSDDGPVTVSSLSLLRAEADHTVNKNGLLVNGTITREPVATGADLVAYSGFSSSNYLEQPYNPDLDFGTGDFCVMGWFKMPASISNEALFYRGYYDGSAYIGPLILVNLDTSGYPKISIYTDPSTSANLDTANYTTPLDNNQWTFISGVRSGNSLKLYINGSLVDDHTITSVTGSLDNSQATVRLGLNHSTSFSNRGSMALWRVSGTAPTAEQVAKIYEDEKVLFQENAKCTLHGTSDSVTALAYDEGTDLLHVGTSSGRSDFKGLRRINNTTDAVGTALSASNGLIVEE